MDKDDLLGFAKKAIPWIGAAATGNVPALVGMAAQAVGEALGTDVKASGDAIAAAVAGATPEQIAALKRADNEFAVKMKELEFTSVADLEKIAASDRDSARRMAVETKSKTPQILGVVIVTAWVLVTAVLLFTVVDEGMREMIGRVLGTLDAALMLVLSYFYGSTSGSARKTELLSKTKGN